MLLSVACHPRLWLPAASVRCPQPPSDSVVTLAPSSVCSMLPHLPPLLELAVRPHSWERICRADCCSSCLLTRIFICHLLLASLTVLTKLIRVLLALGLLPSPKHFIGNTQAHITTIFGRS